MTLGGWRRRVGRVARAQICGGPQIKKLPLLTSTTQTGAERERLGGGGGRGRGGKRKEREGREKGGVGREREGGCGEDRQADRQMK